VADLLAIYLTDHFAGATFGVELVRRSRSKNEGSPFAAPLAELAQDIEADRRTLLSLMGRLDVRPSVLKTSAGWALEKVRRLKPNGGRWSYTPLSRVAELELLVSGIAGKRAMCGPSTLWIRKTLAWPDSTLKLSRSGPSASFAQWSSFGSTQPRSRSDLPDPGRPPE
jgi:hypothetical protein